MILPVPIEGWFYDAVVSSSRCTMSCAVSGTVYEHQVRLVHLGVETVFRLPNLPDHLMWERFIEAWRATADEHHERDCTIIDISGIAV